ncbi:ABC transporter permease [Aestuariivivens marinum]|uniref:ABC transporter permease n=1 Tax=Aestuariivivens marinum TaxID=2913555 RepID=UPI001F5A9BA7|nr:ABC transporter permease [Aestuariivivens marinum]
MSLEVKIYQKERTLSFFKLLKSSLKDIYGSRFLAKQLAVRDIKAQYRQSYLGIVWAFIGPLATAVIWIMLNSSGAITLTDTGIPYPVYAFSGTLIWSIVTASILNPISSTKGAKSILTKVNFPKEALVVSGVYKLLFNSVLKLVLLLVFIFIYGMDFHLNMLFFPLVLVGAILFGTTIGLLLTPFEMLYDDVTRLRSFILKILMYVTPVVYAVPKEGILKPLMEYNPFTSIILTARDVITGLPLDYLTYFLVLMLIMIPLLLLALVFYRLSIPILVERMSA